MLFCRIDEVSDPEADRCDLHEAEEAGGGLVLEHSPRGLNRRGFPRSARSDSPFLMGKEASMHGQGAIGRSSLAGDLGG